MRFSLIECNAIRLVVILFTSLFIFITGIKKPHYSWDVIGYVASAYQQDGYKGEELRTIVYSELEKVTDTKKFAELIGNGSVEPEYRKTIYQNATALEQQIPFYSIRVVYIQCMQVLKSFGISYMEAAKITSSFFAALSVIVLGLIIILVDVPIVTLPFIAVITGYLMISMGATPDSLACFFSLLAILFLLIKNRMVFVVTAILPLMRTDYLILSIIINGLLFLNGQKKLSIFSSVVAIICFELLNKWYGNYGWLAIFNLTFIHYSPYPADMVISHSFKDYLIPYFLAVRDLVTSSWLVLYFMAIYILFLKSYQGKFFQELFAVPFLFIIFHLALFPLYQQRFFVFSVSMILIGILVFLKQGTAVKSPTLSKGL